MPREKDPFWFHVKVLHNGKWKCNFCHKEYQGGVSRIKHHLAGVERQGICACEKVKPQVRSEARKVLKSKGAAESSNGSEGNVEEGARQPVTANKEDAWGETPVPVMPYMSFEDTISSDFGRSLPAQVPILQMDCSFWAQSPRHRAGDSYIEPRNWSDPSSGGDLAPEALTNMPGSVNAEEVEWNLEIRRDCVLMDSRPGACVLFDKNMPKRKRKLEEGSSREAGMDESETWCGKSLPLVTSKLVGKESEEAIKTICEYLMENEIVIIGIYGMGGVGKTAILEHIHNRILENPAFNDAFWVTVPREFSVYELQEKIANAVGLDNLSKDKDVKRRASILHRHLEKMKSSILLLDGLWMHFEIKDVGIPIKKGGLKLVLTTRSLAVCHKMRCQEQIRIRPLSQPNDSWSLFLEKLGRGKELPSEVEGIARSIVDKCWGLPLDIIEIATNMRGVEKVHKWNDLLEKLQELRVELDV